MCWKRAVGFLFSNLRQLNTNIKGKVQKVLANELCHDYALGAHERANCCNSCYLLVPGKAIQKIVC